MITLFAIVDRPGTVPYRQGLLWNGKTTHEVHGKMEVRELADTIKPEPLGGNVYAYIVRDDDKELHDMKVTKLTAKQKKANIDGQPKRILGPFTGEDVAAVRVEAIKAVEKERPKTPDEKASETLLKMRKMEESHEAERDALNAEIAKLKKELKERTGK